MSDPALAKPPWLLRNGHLLTIYPSLFRRIKNITYRRERIVTADDDFLDLDWSIVGGRRLVIISHGLEGSSKRPYVLGMVRAVNDLQMDALAWNFRSCSGEMNRRIRFYHSGETDDLQTVINHALSKNIYDAIILVGFSMGGNQIVCYLGQKAAALPAILSRAIVFSVPLDLASSALQLARGGFNAVYMRRFMRSLTAKIRQKADRFPGCLKTDGLSRMKTFRDFDDAYTAPIHGFKDAADYWKKCSGKRYLQQVGVPLTIVNAADDPFLGPACYPRAEIAPNPNVSLLIPAHGGHVGFVKCGRRYGSELLVQKLLVADDRR